MLRFGLRSAAAAVAAPAILCEAFAQSPQVTLKLHHALAPIAHAHTKLLTPWAKGIEHESGGRIRIVIFPSMQLGGTAAQLFDQARDGMADIIWTAPGSQPDRFPGIEVFELPFVADRHAAANCRALNDLHAAHLSKEFADVQPLGFFANDGGVLHTTKALKRADDIRGLKIHPSTRLCGEALKAMGAQPIEMPLSQVGEALNRKVIDGCVAPWGSVPSLRAHELTKFHTAFAGAPTFSTRVFLLAMNKGKYDALPPDLKGIIEKNGGANAAKLAGAMWDEEAVSVEEMVRKREHNISEVSDHDVLRWHKQCEPVTQNWLKAAKERGLNGEKILADAKSLAAKYGVV